jgi:iron complex outermembrane receptor protein
MEFQIGHKENYIKGDATVYRSDIDNWIIWLPTHYGYWEARNVKQVKAKGIELKLTINKKINNTTIYFNGNWAKNISLNYGDSEIWGDASIGKQLVYVPEFSSGLLTKVTWKDYYFSYKYAYYSERFTTSSNELTDRDRLTAYYMNDVSIGKNIKSKFGEFGLKISVNNLFDEDYESVLKRGMIGRNFTFVFSYKI